MKKECEPPDDSLRRKVRLFYFQTNEGCSDEEIEDFLIQFDRLVFGNFHNNGTYGGFENCSRFNDYLRDQIHFRLVDSGYRFDEVEGIFRGVDGKIYNEMRDRVIRAVVKRAIEGRALNECLKNEVTPIKPLICREKMTSSSFQDRDYSYQSNFFG